MTQRALKGKQRLYSLKITEEQYVLAEEKTSCLGICTYLSGGQLRGLRSDARSWAELMPLPALCTGRVWW